MLYINEVSDLNLNAVTLIETNEVVSFDYAIKEKIEKLLVTLDAEEAIKKILEFVKRTPAPLQHTEILDVVEVENFPFGVVKAQVRYTSGKNIIVTISHHDNGDTHLVSVGFSGTRGRLGVEVRETPELKSLFASNANIINSAMPAELQALLMPYQCTACLFNTEYDGIDAYTKMRTRLRVAQAKFHMAAHLNMSVENVDIFNRDIVGVVPSDRIRDVAEKMFNTVDDTIYSEAVTDVLNPLY